MVFMKKVMDIKELFGLRMRELGKRRNLSQEELAEKAKISPKYISRIEAFQLRVQQK